MPNLFFWSTATKARKPSMLSLAPTPFPSDSRTIHDPQKHISGRESEDESPTRQHLFGRFSPESPESMHAGRSCSPGTKLSTSPAHIRRIYIVTNADDRDAELTQRDILPKPYSFDSGRVRKSRTESQSPRENPPITGVLPVRPEPTLPHGWERRKNRNGRIFYIDHNTRTTSFHPPLIGPELEQSPDELGPLPPWWEMTLLNDGRVVFLDHKTQTTTLRDPRIAKLAETPLAQFNRKSLYLQRKIRHERLLGRFEINVRKSHIFEDSFTVVSNATVDDLRRSPVVVLDGLQPVHHAIQWSELLFHVAFDPTTGLFQSGDNDSLEISHYSSQSTSFLPYFKFLGKLHGLCILHNFPIDPKMVPLFYHLMSEQAADKRPGRARGDSLIPSVIEDPTAACTIDNQGNGKLLLRSYNTLDERTGQPFSVEIKHDNNGFTFSNEEDRDTFAAGFSAHRGALDPNLVLEPFMDGFWEIIRNKGLLRGYTQPEIRKLIGGVSEIDWEQHSECLTGNQEDERLEWFWKIVKSWPLEYREALLRYITGFKRVAATNKFKVFRTPQGSNHFSHFSVHAVQERAVQREDDATLVHVLLVPNFSTYEELEVNLLHTICNCDAEPIFIEGYAEFVFG